MLWHDATVPSDEVIPHEYRLIKGRHTFASAREQCLPFVYLLHHDSSSPVASLTPSEVFHPSHLMAKRRNGLGSFKSFRIYYYALNWNSIQFKFVGNQISRGSYNSVLGTKWNLTSCACQVDLLPSPSASLEITWQMTACRVNLWSKIERWPPWNHMRKLSEDVWMYVMHMCSTFFCPRPWPDPLHQDPWKWFFSNCLYRGKDLSGGLCHGLISYLVHPKTLVLDRVEHAKQWPENLVNIWKGFEWGFMSRSYFKSCPSENTGFRQSRTRKTMTGKSRKHLLWRASEKFLADADNFFRKWQVPLVVTSSIWQTSQLVKFYLSSLFTT